MSSPMLVTATELYLISEVGSMKATIEEDFTFVLAKSSYEAGIAYLP